MSRSGFVEALALVALGAGCGDPLAGGDYKGDPLYEISGVIYADADIAPPTRGVRVTILWGPSDAEDDWGGASIGLATTFPSRFDLQVFAPPPNANGATPMGLGLSVGSPVLYVDNDGDQAYNRDVDDVVGGAADALLVYTWEEGAVFDSAEAFLVEPGYHMASLGPDTRCLDEDTVLLEADPGEVALYLSDTTFAPLMGCDQQEPPPH